MLSCHALRCSCSTLLLLYTAPALHCSCSTSWGQLLTRSTAWPTCSTARAKLDPVCGQRCGHASSHPRRPLQNPLDQKQALPLDSSVYLPPHPAIPPSITDSRQSGRELERKVVQRDENSVPVYVCTVRSFTVCRASKHLHRVEVTARRWSKQPASAHPQATINGCLPICFCFCGTKVDTVTWIQTSTYKHGGLVFIRSEIERQFLF
ncbi:hypothetical protein FPQ18DRAFT_98838 [Pyronema domesticum]|nr:hypothetical protein FPQ18DRAFT_98838 [Pyronema domesticum]